MPASAQTQLWIEQLGTGSYDVANGVASDAVGGCFVGGMTNGGLAGPNAGGGDIWLSRRDAAGAALWTVQIGSPQGEALLACAEDGAGGVVSTGITYGAFGGPLVGAKDAWVARHDGAGQELWRTQFGTVGNDDAYGIAHDGGGGYFVCGWGIDDYGQPHGTGFDAWVVRLDAGGDLSWKFEFGMSLVDEAWAVAADGSGGAFVCGQTYADLGSGGAGTSHAWIARLDATGSLLWLHDLGPLAPILATCLAADGAGGAFVGGYKWGVSGVFDAWIANVDSAGSLRWIQPFIGPQDDFFMGLSADGAGGVYASGYSGEVMNPFNPGEVLLVRFDSDGQTLWSTKFGDPAVENESAAIAPDGRGGFFTAGMTRSTLGSASFGQGDAWVARFDGSCNPGTTYCVASSTSIAGCAASLGAAGSPTLSDPDSWTVTSGPVPGGNLGLLLFGSSGKGNMPYGSLGGQMCVASPTFRTAPESSSGDQGQWNGSFEFTLGDLIAASSIVRSGATINAQMWARDPANADGFLLSDGIEVVVCP